MAGDDYRRDAEDKFRRNVKQAIENGEAAEEPGGCGKKAAVMMITLLAFTIAIFALI